MAISIVSMVVIPEGLSVPEGESSYLSIIPMLPVYVYHSYNRSTNWFPGNKKKVVQGCYCIPGKLSLYHMG